MRKLLYVISILIVASMLFTACSPAVQEEVEEAAEEMVVSCQVV